MDCRRFGIFNGEILNLLWETTTFGGVVKNQQFVGMAMQAWITCGLMNFDWFHVTQMQQFGAGMLLIVFAIILPDDRV